MQFVSSQLSLLILLVNHARETARVRSRKLQMTGTLAKYAGEDLAIYG